MPRFIFARKISIRFNYLQDKVICLILIGMYFLFSLAGCSTMNGVFSGVQFWNSSIAQNAHTSNKKVALIVSRSVQYKGNPDSHYRLGSYYQDSGRHRKAIEEFKKAIYIYPYHVNAYNRMGVSYHFLRDFSKAIEMFKIALTLNTNLDYVYNNLGYTYLISENFDDAVESFQKAISLNDKVKRYHNNLGLAYAKNGQFDKALFGFKIAGDEAKAHYNLAVVYYEKGLYDQAANHFRKAVAINPSFGLAAVRLEAAEAFARISQPSREITLTGELTDVEQQTQDKWKAQKITTVVHQKDIDEENKTKTTEMITMISHSIDNKTVTENTTIPVKFTPKATGKQVVSITRQEDTKKHDIFNEGAIEISNGNGVNRMARSVGAYLKRKGIKVVRLTNADNFHYPETIIYYQKGYLHAAYYVAQQIPKYKKMEKITQFDRSNINIKVLIGEDIIPYKTIFTGSNQQS